MTNWCGVLNETKTKDKCRNGHFSKVVSLKINNVEKYLGKPTNKNVLHSNITYKSIFFYFCLLWFIFIFIFSKSKIYK
jgi:hypothetical protein